MPRELKITETNLEGFKTIYDDFQLRPGYYKQHARSNEFLKVVDLYQRHLDTQRVSELPYRPDKAELPADATFTPTEDYRPLFEPHEEKISFSDIARNIAVDAIEPDTAATMIESQRDSVFNILPQIESYEKNLYRIDQRYKELEKERATAAQSEEGVERFNNKLEKVTTDYDDIYKEYDKVIRTYTETTDRLNKNIDLYNDKIEAAQVLEWINFSEGGRESPGAGLSFPAGYPPQKRPEAAIRSATGEEMEIIDDQDHQEVIEVLHKYNEIREKMRPSYEKWLQKTLKPEMSEEEIQEAHQIAFGLALKDAQEEGIISPKWYRVLGDILTGAISFPGNKHARILHEAEQLATDASKYGRMASQIFGALATLIPIGKIIAPKVAAKAHMLTYKSQQLARLIERVRKVGISADRAKRIIMAASATATTFGVHAALRETLTPDHNVAEKVLGIMASAGFGVGLGTITGGIYSGIVGIPAEAAYGYLTTKLTGGSQEDSLINAAIFTLFAVSHRRGLRASEKEVVYAEMRFLMEEALKTKADAEGVKYTNSMIRRTANDLTNKIISQFKITDPKTGEVVDNPEYSIQNLEHFTRGIFKEIEKQLAGKGFSMVEPLKQISEGVKPKAKPEEKIEKPKTEPVTKPIIKPVVEKPKEPEKAEVSPKVEKHIEKEVVEPVQPVEGRKAAEPKIKKPEKTVEEFKSAEYVQEQIDKGVDVPEIVREYYLGKKPAKKPEIAEKPKEAPIIPKAEEKAAKAKPGVEKPIVAVPKKGVERENIPIKDITVDLSEFQGRRKPYSQKTVDRIIKAVEEGKFDWNEFDDIKLWKNEKGELTVLAGHSRLEAARQLVEKGYDEFKELPARIVKGTKEEAAEKAEMSNILATPETLLDGANRFRKKRVGGMSKTQLLTEAKKVAGKNAQTILSLSYLSKGGSVEQALEAFEDVSTKDARDVLSMATWIGKVKEKFPELTRSHETEMFTYLQKTFNVQFKRSEEFISHVSVIVDRHTEFGKFDGEPLNFKDVKAVSLAELEYNKLKEEAKKHVKDAEKELSDKRNEFTSSEGATKEKIAEALMKYEQRVINANIALTRIMEKDADVKASLRKQGNIFGDVGGYSDTGGYAETGGYYSKSNKHLKAFALPEIVKLAKELMKGRVPSIVKRFRSSMIGDVLGRMYASGDGDIKLKADIFKDPGIAAKVLAHEIGHLADYLPDKTMKRGNILGRIGSLRGYLKTLLEEYPDSPLKILTAKDRYELRKMASRLSKIKKMETEEAKVVTTDDILAVWRDIEAKTKDLGLYNYIAKLSTKEKVELVKSAMKGDIVEWFTFQRKPYSESSEDVKKLYRKLVEEEIQKRRLIERNAIMNELKQLTQIWKPFNEMINPKFTAYRYSPIELYADAVSVLINDPALLKQVAPKFNKAFINYMERKPEFKKVYESIQKAIEDGSVQEQRQKDIREMLRTGQEKQRQLEKTERTGLGDIMNSIKKELVDHNAPMIKMLKADIKAGKPIKVEENPVFWSEELPYISGEVFQYLRDVNNEVVSKAKKDRITNEDIAVYMFLYRVATERAKIANPKGYTAKEAVEQLGELKKQLGEAKFGKLVKHAANFQKVRQKDVISVLEESGMYGPELIELIKANDGYATFVVQKFMEAKYGRGVARVIIPQIGTFQDITDPFAATLIKDKSILFAANTTKIKNVVIKWMFKNHPDLIQEADTKYVITGKGKGYHEPIKSKDPKQGRITFLQGGKVQSYYVPKYISDTFNRDPFEAGKILQGIEMATRPLKEIFVGRNPYWMLWNIQRDTKAWAKQLPGGSAPKIIKYLWKSKGDAFKDVFLNQSTKDVADMYRRKMLILDRQWRTVETSPEEQLDRILMDVSSDLEKYQTVVSKSIGAMWQLLSDVGKYSERIVKIAGYKYLTDLAIPQKELEHLVRVRAGSPDFLRGGTHRRFLNAVFLFSNAGVQGIRGAIEAAREDPASYAFKTFKYDILPKILMYVTGVLGAVMAALGIELGEDTEEKLQELKLIMDRIPDRDKENYICVPLGLTETGKAVYYIIPHDFQGQVIGGLFWDIMNANKPKDIANLLDYMSGGMPYSSLNPYIGEGLKWWRFLTNKNPYNSWSGRNVLSDDVFEAIGEDASYAFEEMVKDTWNSMGGSIVHRFKSDNYAEVSSELEKILEIPIASGFFRRFIRISNWGERERYREVKKEVRAKKAVERLEFQPVLRKVIVGDRLTPGEEQIIINNLDWLITKSGKPSQNLIKYIGKGSVNAFVAEYMNALSNDEKIAVMQKYVEIHPTR